MKIQHYRPMSLILIFVLMITLFVPAFGETATNDYSTHWAKNQIQAGLDAGIISGYPDGTFRPNNSITRAEFMSLVNNRFNFTSGSEATYSDVPANAWFAPIVSKAKAAEYITGYSDGSIHPYAFISRQEVAVILSRLQSLTPTASTSTYTDTASIANWSKDSIIALAEANIMVGYPDHSFKPVAQIERAEALVAIQKCFDYQAVTPIPTVIIDVDSISATDETMSLIAGGQTGLISILFNPTDATNQKINWTSSDEAIATVSRGIVTPIAEGTAIITATSDADSAKQATVTVTVGPASQVIVQPIIDPANAVNLGKAGDFVILTKTGISTVPNSKITGNIGVSPIDATALTGFSLTADATNVFSTSDQLTGKAYASDYTSPTPSNLTTAVSNMEAAYTDAAGRAADYTELYAGDISGKTLTPGVYKWGTGVLIASDVTLSGGPNDIWIFQISEGITQANGTSIILTGGAQAKNIFWQAAETVSIGTDSHFEGIVLCQTNITLGNKASINGRLFAQTAVTLNVSTVVAP